MKESLDIEDLLLKVRINAELWILFLSISIAAILFPLYFGYSAYIAFFVILSMVLFILSLLFMSEALAYKKLKLAAEFLRLINVDEFYISEDFVVGTKMGIFLLALKYKKGLWLIKLKQKIKTELIESIKEVKMDKNSLQSALNTMNTFCYDYIPSIIHRKDEAYMEIPTEPSFKLFFKPRYKKRHYILRMPFISKEQLTSIYETKLARIYGNFVIPDTDGKFIEGRGIGYYVQINYAKLHTVSEIEKISELIEKLRREKI